MTTATLVPCIGALMLLPGVVLADGRTDLDTQEVACMIDSCLQKVVSSLARGASRSSRTSLTPQTLALLTTQEERTHLRSLLAKKGCQAQGLRLHQASTYTELNALLREHKRNDASQLICGTARVGRNMLALAAPRGASIRVGTRNVHFEVYAPFTDPVLYIMQENGTVQAISQHRQLRSGAYSSSVSHLDSAWSIQLLGRGPQGLKPIALWSRTKTRLPSSWRSLAKVPKLSYASARHLRKLQGAPPLRPNRLLARTAEHYATQVCAQRQATHELRKGQGPWERLQASHLTARSVGEAVLIAPSEQELVAALVESPSHLATLQTRDFTDLGIGAAKNGEYSCKVLLFAGWPRVSR